MPEINLKLPQPKGWRILIEPIKVQEKTSGGLFLPEQTKEVKEMLRNVGKVVAMGSLCYRHAKFEGGEPWCAVGDHVGYGTYTGQEVVVKGDDGAVHKFRIINDDEVICGYPDPESVQIYV